MNKLFLLFFLLFSLQFSAQEKEQLYYYHVSVANAETLKITPNKDGSLNITDTVNSKANKIFAKYKVLVFRKAFPYSKKENLKKVYKVTTNSDVLLGQLQNISPEKYTGIGEYFPHQDAYYPNDYGITSPVANLGVPYPMTGLDLINAPQAWSITTGDPKVVIGISDGRVDSTNIDLKGRVSKYLKYFDLKSGGVCAHGTGIASSIGARANNAFGISGICSDCDMITHGYGRFDYIQELVEAGAKVINTSWVLCGFGAYHQNVQERINEYYEEGILIVAAAGNAKKCNPNLKDYASNYGYPASYKNVISVTKIFADCGFYDDCIVEDEKYGTIAYKLKDRHVTRMRMKKEGSFDTLTPINSQFGAQHNLAVDIAAPAETYSMGRPDCGYEEDFFVGMTSGAAAFVTGTIGLIWSANYCLGSAEVESILKLTSADIENLPGNEPFKMKLGAGRVDAYKAVKMAHDMQLGTGTVEVAHRDFYRFDFTLKSSPYQIDIYNQTFRDSSTVDFKARNSIHLKPNTHLKPDSTGFVKLSIDPLLPTDECFPKPVIPRPKVERDSVQNFPRHTDPFEIIRNEAIKGIVISPVESEIDTDYEIVITVEEKEIFRQKYKKNEIATIPLEEIQNEIITITATTALFRMTKKFRVNYQ
tara:strand:+ start:171660 stop:173600 length:1941 start_codon:yes stop_codon:yes gene_type:complete